MPSFAIASQATHHQMLREIRKYLREMHGPHWRWKIRILLVFGEPAEIEAVAPTLFEQRWLVGPKVLLLWGGGLQVDPDHDLITCWRSLTRWRPLDGAIWALTAEQSAATSSFNAGIHRLQRLSRKLRWQLPLHLWQVCDTGWRQNDRETQPVGLKVAPRFTVESIEADLTALLPPLLRVGWQQVNRTTGHDFLLRLSSQLRHEGIARWKQVLTPQISALTRNLPLRGLWFSLPLHRPDSELPHYWLTDPAWSGVLANRAPRAKWRGKQPLRVATLAGSTLAAVCAVGMLMSFFSNQRQIGKVQAASVALQQTQGSAEEISALNEMTHWMGKIDGHVQVGAPWYQRFALNRNQPLFDANWPGFVEANNRLIRDPAAANLHQQLTQWVKLPPDRRERAEQTAAAYDHLKAYLMMADPQQADPAFLAQALADAEPERAGLPQGRWLYLAPELWSFYGRQLQMHPELGIRPDVRLIAQARQLLIGQLGERNGEAALYQQVLDTVASHYADLTLGQMLGDTDATALLTSRRNVPGVFTRQAYENQARKAIDEVAQARREQIDWVLSDGQDEALSDVSPQRLKERLTARYFKDYSSAWLGFLNGLRWRKADTLSDVIDQLTLMSDIRQSPLIALMNTLAYQGQAGQGAPALTNSLVQSAQKLVAREQAPVIDQRSQGPIGPLDGTFGPLLAMLGSSGEQPQTETQLTLQALLTRVTRVRLKLQQISNAADPQAMTQAMAQSVFQGKNDDLTDTQSYAGLLAASLGAEWGGIGQTLFVQPLDQAWHRILQPSTVGLNHQWQRAILTPWQNAFTSRYPFVATASDASLPMLGQMIRSDTGRIEQFLQRELSGILRKEGDTWVADPRYSQGLRFNPQFLQAINQLSHLADVLYTDGGMGLSFELRGKPVRNIVDTTFILDGQKHHYFNQQESWQRFDWPGTSDGPGASLAWTSVRAGERLYGDFQGTWGLIRLLEEAKATALDDADSRYRLEVKAPDGLLLTWHLRTELGAGPLALLQLRGFRLPKDIFLAEGASSSEEARKGSIL
jgi:type VI secretion system protein ImpL